MTADDIIRVLNHVALLVAVAAVIVYLYRE